MKYCGKKMCRNRSKSSKTSWTARLSLLGVLALSVGFVFAAKASAADVSDRKESLVQAPTMELDVDFDVRVGIAGVYKNGFQTPVVLSWRSDAADFVRVELETIDSDGVPFMTARELDETERAAGRAETRFIFPKANAALTARLIDGAGNTAKRVFTPSDKRERESDEGSLFKSPTIKPIFVTIGTESLGFSEAFAELRWKEDRRPAIVPVSSFDELPTDFRSYEAIDRLFITTANAQVFEGVTADSRQIRAIEEWVQRGGSVVLLAEEKAITLLSEGGALANLSPGAKFAERAQEFRSVNALVTELNNVKNLAMTGSKSNPYLRTPVIQELKEGAKVEMQEVETPLLVVRPVGLGSVIYFAGDLSVAPLAEWSGRGKLMLKILGVRLDKTASNVSSSSYIKRGYIDLSGQVRSALDSFVGVKTTPFSLIAGLIFAYLLFIAPLDWFLVKKVIKKPNVTWITFPIFAVLFSAIAVWIVKASTPEKPVFNQVDVIDVDMTTGIVRDSSWIGFYSPTSERYELNLTPNQFVGAADGAISINKESVVADLMPLSLAGDGIGGAEQKSYLTRIWTGAYDMGFGEDYARLTDVPMTTRSSKSFYGRWTAKLEGLPEISELTDNGLVLQGTIHNPFDVPIYSAFVLFKGGAYSLGTLAPGETQLQRGMTRLESQRVLNEHQSSVPTANLGNWKITTYNNASTRLPYILRTASFYNFGGGEDNFGVLKRMQRDVDISEVLRCGRAVVFGTIVDAQYNKYEETNELARRSVDAVQDEKLSERIAEQQGETLENAMAAAIQKYGLTGTSDSFQPTNIDWRRGEGETGAADERTVVVRLIVPLSHAVK